MRIVSGRLGGRRLRAEVADGTRPTSDRVREGLGSALAARGAFDDARVLDLFAGTGALGLEALSRGARSVVAVETDRKALRCIADNVQALGAGEHVRVVSLDLLKSPDDAAKRLAALAEAPFSLVFADPPYALCSRVPELLDALLAEGALAEQAVVVVEHPSAFELTDSPRLANFAVAGRYRYGDTGATIVARARQMRDGRAGS